MKAVIQRVSKASVEIEEEIKSEIKTGLLILLGVGDEDNKEDAEWLAKKIASLRIFPDAEGKMNKSIADVNGEALVVSQFTFHAKTKKGTRPSFIHAAHPDKAIPLYDFFVNRLEVDVKKVKTGEFGADMKVSLTNDGPVTIVIDTKNKV